MTLVGHLFLLSAALCCTAAPANEGPTCPHPGTIEDAALDGDWNNDSYPKGTIAVYSCHPGFSRLGSIKKICGEGSWKFFGNKGQCRKRSCGHPGDIPFGTFELIREEEFVFGAIVQYSCDEGYHMVSRQKTRECTASGWSNFPPHCEVRNCPPVVVPDDVSVISTSYDDEFSVGQVIRFECKNPRFKLDGPSEIFCKSEGEWNLKPPICKEITCNLPNINNAIVKNPKDIYKEDNLIQFECERGYKPTRNREAKCTKDGWSPTPACEAITCDAYYSVPNGRLIKEKTVYKEGDTIALECDEYYTSQYGPNKLSTCTSNGWDPIPACLSKKCDRPELKNGYFYYTYNFPVSTRSSVLYYCNDNYASHERSYYGRSYCTKTGWDYEPKCSRVCQNRDAPISNANIKYTSNNVLEGEEIEFTCHKGFKTPDGKTDGKRICLSNGQFSPAKCSRTCSISSRQHGTYEPNKDEFEVGEYVQYECNVGYKSSNGYLKDSSQCLSEGWSAPPQCKPITCTFKWKTYKNLDRLEYSCPNGQRPPDTPLAQCFYYGWGPPPACKVIECTIPKETNLKGNSEKNKYRKDEKESFFCENGFELVESSASICTVNGWNPPLPVCQDENLSTTTLSPENTERNLAPTTISPKDSRLECAPAYATKNVQIINPKGKYYSNDVVEFKCVSGYKLYGPAKVKCKDNGVWESSPQCIQLKKCKDPPNINNGKKIEGLNHGYYTDSIVKYTCNPGFHISGSDQMTCVDGQWTALPTCTGDSCGAAPSIKNGFVTKQKADFQHGERAIYQCNDAFAFSDGKSAECIEGKWEKIPTCVTTSCKSPPNGNNSKPRNRKKEYLSGEKEAYICDTGYSLDQSMNDKALCENTVWKDIPVCRKIGGRCGPPPTVQYGDTTDIRRAEYESGSYVTFKCPDYYKLEGKERIRCNNGVWENAPVCLEPCTIKDNDMNMNNIQLRWIRDRKLYSTHDDSIEFVCLSGFEAPPGTEMRQKCNRGVVQYPKCFRQGYCVLQPSEMFSHNIHYNKSTIVENGETISFECFNGLVPEDDLQSTCKQSKINYPSCVPSKSCSAPTIRNGKIKTKLGEIFYSGSSVEFVCDENYVLSGNINVQCENGQWIDLPQCLKPCKISIEDIDKNNVTLKFPDDLNKVYTHGAEVDISCKSGFSRQNQASLKGVCSNGNMTYQRCFSGYTCRLLQDALDEKNLELHENHNNEIFYTNGEHISFKCKEGHHSSNELTGQCTDEGITYPECIQRRFE